MGYAKKSPWVIHYDGSSCNGCDIEVLATLCPGFDAERFGVINTGNPKHADIFLVTGSVNEQNAPVIKQIYDQMIEPKVVVACGICACSGGIFKDCYNVWGGVDTVIPVDAYVPGCAVRPESLIDAVVAGVEILEQRESELKAKGKKSKASTREKDTLSPNKHTANGGDVATPIETKPENSKQQLVESDESSKTETKDDVVVSKNAKEDTSEVKSLIKNETESPIDKQKEAK